MMVKKLIIKVVLLIIPHFLLFVILTMSILAPFLEYKRLEISRKFYEIPHFICNQLPTRSFFIYTSPMALCARCFSIYLAMFITGLFLLKNKIKHLYWKIAIILLIPCIIDGGTQYLGFRLSNNILRAITGAAAGVGISLIFFPFYVRFVDFVTERR